MSDLGLLTNVHFGNNIAISSNTDKSNTFLVSGTYKYYHYLCDGVDDRGWGCGYRTLQTICSWLKHNVDGNVQVPSIRDIQEILVHLQDKESNFIGSRQWIGSFEVCLVIEHLFGVLSKILHVNSGEELSTITDRLCDHFQNHGSPIMMGGDVDCSSKGIMGIHVGDKDTYLCVVDPHHVGKDYTAKFLQNKGWVKWQPQKDFITNSFYNLCLPQTSKNKTQ